MSSSITSLRGMVYAAMFAALTAVGGLLAIPGAMFLSPVPLTLQTLFTALAGLLLGGHYGALSQVVYVVLGLIGLPVFDGGKSGLGVLLGPAGGYLVGFVLGAYVTGRVAAARKDAGFAWLCLSVVLGYVVVYAVGVTQLSIVAHLGIRKALAAGALPFVLGDCLKVIAAALLASRIRKQPFFKGYAGAA